MRFPHLKTHHGFERMRRRRRRCCSPQCRHTPLSAIIKSASSDIEIEAFFDSIDPEPTWRLVSVLFMQVP
jgi:hypothetical protein